MRAPISLEDRTLLADEPFASFFPVRQSGLKKGVPFRLLQKLSRLVEAEPGGAQAVEEWVNLAFEPSNSEQLRDYGLRRSRAQQRLTAKTFDFFVKFYWYLATGQDTMKLLRTQKLGGFTPRCVSVKLETDPFDEPMSPLTVLSDDDDAPVSTLDPNPSTVVRIKEEHETGLQSATTFVLPLTENTTGLFSDYVDGAPEMLRVPTISDTPSAESIPILLTPVRQKHPRRAASPERRRRNRLPAPVPPVTDDTSALLLPAGLWLSPTVDTSETLEGAPDLAVLHTPSRPASPGLLVPPMSDWSSRTGDSLCSFPQNLPAGIELKLEPSEEPSDPLRLLDSLDVLENWLDLALNEDDTEQEVLPISDPLPQLQYLPKSPLPRLPPIWAQSRQEVCESFEWFRSYQGGVYQNNGTVKGYFLSAFSANRDIFACGGKIVISHGGGRAATSRTQRGQTTNIAADDQRAHDLSVRALIETHRSNQPLVLLIDDKYEPFPFDLGSRDVYMAILGFYKIIHVWAEYQPSSSHPSGRVIRYKFAFQWCEDQGEPWWLMGSSDTAAVPQAASVPRSASVDTLSMVPVPTAISPLEPDNLYSPCSTCLQKSPRVYQQAWACLKPVCPSFWITSTGRSLPDHLDYNPEFLSVIDFRPLPLAYRNALLPKPPVLEPKDGITTSYRYSRGWHCGNCGRLSSRSAWEHYECPNCKDTHAIVGNVRPANTLTSIRVPVTDKFVDSLIDPYSGIQRMETKMFNHFDAEGATGRYQTFILPEEKGKIHLIQTNRMAKVEADRIFEAYQRQASDGTLLFRRWPLRSTKLRGPCLTNYFSQNSGEPYHYVGGTSNTVPFDRAPSAVIQARKLIEKRILEALGVPYTFNEVLSAAYMEQQKMAFHSDSERGLGPVVAGLSMGSPALMHFRVLNKYVPPDQQRTNAMTVVLRHGDVLVMEGAGVQDYYEHTVVPCNFRIAATARLISPEHY